jgi:uncharacterized protein YeaO (DUF488 family)
VAARRQQRERANLTVWHKEIAPSTGLRKWFGHDPDRWTEFRRRYVAELDANRVAVETLRDLVGKGPVTLVYATRDERHNHALVLAEYLERKA